MRDEADPGKSVPVIKEFQREILLAPFTPEKPIANGKAPICTNGGQYYTAETEDYLSRFTHQDQGESSYAGFAWEANDQGERWAPPYTPPSTWLSEGASSGNSIHQDSVMKETEAFGEWRGMTFKDLLALNHGLGNPIGDYQTSNGFPSNLDFQFHSAGLVSENQERMGFRVSNPLTQTAEIQQSGYQTSNGFLSNLDSQFHSTGLVPENQERMGFRGSNQLTQTAEIQQKSALPNGSGPVFAPETPDQCKRLQDNSADKNPNKQNGEENQVSVIEDLLGMKVTQSATDSIAIESYDPEKGDKAIEQKPRRKKHRPKVIREAKPKQGPKPRTPKPPTNANETPKPKRKYVRKSKTNLPSTTPPESIAEALDCKIPDPTVKSCKKSLNFDMEDQIKEKNPTDPNETPKQKKKYVRKRKTKIPAATPPESGAEALGCKIPGPAVKSCKKGLNFDLEDQDPYPVREKDVITETTREESAYDVFKNNQTVKGYMSMSERDAHSIPHPTEASSNYACSPNYSACASSNESEHIRGLKRANSYSADVPNTGTENQAVHCTPAQANYMSMGNANFSCTHGMFFPEINKKRKTERVIMPKPSHILSSTSLQNNSREAVLTSKYYYSTPAPHFNIIAEANSQATSVSSHQNTQSVNWGDVDKLNKRSKAPTCVIDLNSQEGSAKGRIKGIRKKNVKTVDTSCMEAQPKVSKPKQSRRKYVKKNSATKFVTSSFNMVYAHSLNLYGDQHFTGNSKGPFLALPWINTSTTMVEDIIEGMKLLSINRESSSVQYQEQNSLIPYQVQNQQKNALVLYQRDGVMIPFEGTQSSKRYSRAKVDLDDETNRVWNLLLENINNQGIDGTDEEKTKWWEEERKVFRGRVDSFIARMRLVQGDRRFSPWKGSVVDSVVGVFLTQNVSDHLSSSAYMSLAARYPVKSANKVRRDSEEEIGPIVEEPEICIVELDDNSDNLALNEKTVEGHICDMNSRNIHDSDVSEEKVVNSKESQLYGAGSIKELETPSTSVDDRAIDDVTSTQHSVISSQNSVESPSVPTSGKMVENGLSSDISSEGEDPTNSSNPGSSQCSGSFVELLKMAEKPMLHATHPPIDPEEVVIYDEPSQKAFRTEMDSFSIVLNKCSTVYSVDEESRSVNSTRLVESFTTEAHNVTTESATDFQLHKKDSNRNMGPSSPSDNVCSSYVLEGEEMVIQSQRQPVNEQQDKINLLTEESMSPQMNINLPTVSRDNVATESTCGSNILGEAHNVLKEDAAKQKTGKNPKKPSYDWDSLRKQAQANGRTRHKSANTMDSIDWEAIRCADVHDIAYTIRERGMNNRLAERIKEFLDRLVNDHGSIDLEWLRDVPPDKAKEYLLSIKGLGLKSVECVRLLTLHHLAFPVDTNVGRIAVRLGWVPLQPLPESLQLHLLELYPILESIQKYLWPRLCKLDQRTLYELHYHMITFGKVFCTKRQPNCNACPLRGECRHFASAFASARLALPGPQDKSIILPDQSNPTHQDPPQVTINSLPMPLLMADQTLEPKSEVRNCEPIVEIPASPEPEPIQTLECDIEDAFSEDPNEIPTIKLNVEEFTQTLQAYMQSNKELQGDMSKALVALAAEAASIPAPKLKNVSRLRTEHHVYELPDTHYLLRGMDKREPDDPCPYLLAIWAPGETANSTEPPEKRCNFQEPGELCSDETCSYCNSQREANSQIVRGTILIPCRTAMRGSFPLNGTYFQVNEVFADHVSSLNPIHVPTTSLWNLPRRTVYFGTSVPTIFKGLSTEYIQHCFWRGYVCVRGFDQKTRAPRPLMARLHFSAYKSKAGGKSSEQN